MKMNLFPMKNSLKRITMSAGIGTLAVFVAAGCGSVRGGYESAPYQVVRAAGKFEVRDYPVLTVVETPMARGSDGADGSFNRLFRFITGNNDTRQKNAMTTPVFMSGSDTNTVMAFVMPKKMAMREVPAPLDGAVTVRQLGAGRFAVLRYSGGRSAKKEAESLSRLKAWMEAEKFGAVSPPVYGYFDPPWTPAFLRRNEVMLRTAEKP
jgi:hypothetical protein